MADVRLVDLEVFKRYSLAIRQETAPADELLAVLDETRRQVEAAGPPAGRIPRRRRGNPAGEAGPAGSVDDDGADVDSREGA